MPQPRKSAFAKPYIVLIRRLVARRRELRLTQEQLGAAYGEDQSFISRVERCQRRLDVYEFVRFCRALDLKPSALLDEVEADLSMP
jgi:transcriptional regulator with XRE-family HTH domain